MLKLKENKVGVDSLTKQLQHTFAILAYGDSPFLPECIESVLSQSVKSEIILTTSTPSSYIMETAKKFGIEVKVNDAPSGIATDWSFAAEQCKTPFFTLAHQDDIYLPEYTEKLLPRMSDAVIGFTDYGELREDEAVEKNRLMAVKRILLFPIRIRKRCKSKFLKKSLLRLGNPICCPSVMYHNKYLPKPLFDAAYSNNLDWDAWLRAAEGDGEFVYANEKLMLHRVHKDSETTKQIENSGRAQEDLKMFLRLWPKFIAKIIFRFYQSGYRSNSTEPKE